MLFLALKKVLMVKSTPCQIRFSPTDKKIPLIWIPLIWMFHSRTFNNKINQLHEKALGIVHGDLKSKFDKLDKLLEKDGSFSIRHRNIQMLATEIFNF